ncbi:hypothetical protein DS745_09940 [Anaerobacillus alkaliphilus]|uniref:Uncharacterized protein n=1 Tax=Anaerobacillus alkaliphilus TaxID=1548597 RepID=A0A4Q0VTA4_9BACI|nr:hypothetical protein [Anaerobacillus alkaliphilus]RXJ01786.1 hypothetical protein DS745_09940 [Anaerobacillus alkaliphilus]
MKDQENEIVYDGTLELDRSFVKEFNGIDATVQQGIQEAWNSGINDKTLEKRAEDMKDRMDS